MINIVILAVLILPWLILPFGNLPEPTRLIKSSFYDFAMLAIIVSAMIDGLNFKYKNRYLAWLSAYLFFAIAWNWYLPLILGQGYNATTIESCIHVILSIFATICVCSKIERQDFVNISKAICFSSVAMSIFGILQYVGLDPMRGLATYVIKETRHVAATLDHPDIFGNYIALSLPYFLFHKDLRYKIGLAIAIIGILVSQSSLSIIAGAISLLVFLYFKYQDNLKTRIGILLASGGLILCGIFIKSFNKLESGFSGRLWAWGEFIRRDQNYIFGKGLGCAKSYLVRDGNNFWMFCHNDYLERFLEIGIIGCILFLLVIFVSFRSFNYNKENALGLTFLASFTAFLILMAGSFPMEIAPLALGGLIAWWGVQKV